MLGWGCRQRALGLRIPALEWDLQVQQSLVEATGKATTECQPAPWHATGPGNALASVSGAAAAP